MTNNQLIGIVFVSFSIILNAFSQIFLKRSAILQRNNSDRNTIFNLHSLIAICCAGIASLFFIFSLFFIPLTMAFPLTGILYIIVPLSAHRVFHEQLQPIFWLGPVLIIVGISIIIAGL